MTEQKQKEKGRLEQLGLKPGDPVPLSIANKLYLEEEQAAFKERRAARDRTHNVAVKPVRGVKK